MKMKKFGLGFGLASVLFISNLANAADYSCPPPSAVNCVPAQSQIGNWVTNGGQTTGNYFAPNNQCANVISLSLVQKRLLCCYAKCGVFIQDVNAQRCIKVSESQFSCM